MHSVRRLPLTSLRIIPVNVSCGLLKCSCSTGLQESVAPRMTKKEKYLNFILKEHDYFLTNGLQPVPQELSEKQLTQLLRTRSTTDRIQTFNFHYKAENHSFLKKIKGEEDAANQDDSSRNIENLEKDYRSIHRISKSVVIRHYNYNMFQDMILNDSQQIVFDFSFEGEMRDRDISSLCKQIRDVWSYNRTLAKRFQIIFSGLKKNSHQYKMLESVLVAPNNGSFESLEDFPVTIYEDDYLSRPDRDANLVYLSPNSVHTLKKFDPNANYVIGALVDKCTSDPLSLSKARRLSLPHRRLPLHIACNEVKTTRALTLDIVIQMLVSMRDSGRLNEIANILPRRYKQS